VGGPGVAEIAASGQQDRAVRMFLLEGGVIKAPDLGMMADRHAACAQELDLP
jgi:hypothetical protein